MNNIELFDDADGVDNSANPTCMVRIKLLTSDNSFCFSNALCDTGSFISAINYQFALKSKLRVVPLEPSDVHQIFVADSKPVNIDFKCRIRFQIGSLTINHWVYCVKNLSHSLLFGRQFLRQFGVNIYSDRGILKIKGVSVPFISSKDYASMLVLSKTTKVLPNSEQIVHVKGNAFKKNLDCKIRPLTNPIAPGLQFGNEIIKNDGKNCILSVNRTGRTIRLRRNTPIAYLIRSVAPLPEKPAVPSNFNLVISSPPSTHVSITTLILPCKIENNDGVNSERTDERTEELPFVSQVDRDNFTDVPSVGLTLGHGLPASAENAVPAVQSHAPPVDYLKNSQSTATDFICSAARQNIQALVKSADLHDSNERERELLAQNGKNQNCLQFCNSASAQNAQCQNSGKPDASDLHSIDPSLPGTVLAEPATSSKLLVPGRLAAVPTIELVAGAASNESVPSHLSAPSINSLDEKPRSRSVASQTDSEDQFLQNNSNSNLKRTFEELGFNLDDTDLTPDEKLTFKNLVEAYSEVFCLSNAELDGCVLGKLELKLKPGADAKYSRARIYPMSTPDRLELERQVSDLLKWGFIERSKSRFSSPAFLVAKHGSPIGKEEGGI